MGDARQSWSRHWLPPCPESQQVNRSTNTRVTLLSALLALVSSCTVDGVGNSGGPGVGQGGDATTGGGSSLDPAIALCDGTLWVNDPQDCGADGMREDYLLPSDVCSRPVPQETLEHRFRARRKRRCRVASGQAVGRKHAPRDEAVVNRRHTTPFPPRRRSVVFGLNRAGRR